MAQAPPAAPAPVELTKTEKMGTWMMFTNYFSQALGIQVTLTFMNMFMTDYLMMTPLVVAAVLSVGRIIDTATSFIAAPIIQKSNLRTGPYRTYILVNGPLLAIGNFCIFLNPNVTQTMKLVVFIIGYLFRNLPQNFLIAGQQALIAKMAGSNQAFRLAITAKNSQGTTVASIVTSMTVIPMVEYFNGVFGLESGRGYLIASLLLCILHTIAGVTAYIGLGAFDKYDPDAKKVEGSAQSTRMSHVLTDTAKNRYAWVLFSRGLLTQIGSYTISPLNAYYFRYSLRDMNLLTINRTVTSWLGLAVVALSPPIARKLGKKKSILIAGIMGFITNLVYARFADGNFPVYMAMAILNRIMMGPSGAIGVNQWIDAADYQYFKTGRDSRPFIMSLSSMTMKIGQFISSFTYAILLIFCDYQSLGGGQATMDVGKMVLGMYGFQAIISGINLLIYIFGWNKSDAEFAEMANHNRQVMAERAAAAAAAAAGGTPPASAGGGGGS